MAESKHIILQGNCTDVLKTLDPESFRCCITSPPYWGLRDYGVDGQLGQEKTPEEYVENLVSVFKEVKRVLTRDGTLWLNLGDSYYGSQKGSGGTGKSSSKQNTNHGSQFAVGGPSLKILKHPTLKPKDLCGIPWRVALALQADGWYLRSDIIWHKPNPMPESVLDRPTRSHEYVFLLSKSSKYYYDANSIAEPSIYAGKIVKLGEKSLSRGQAAGANISASGNGLADNVVVTEMRNKRSVWTITPKPYRGAHFATFPPELVETCIKAGSAVGDTVLDPFGGAGTTSLIARNLGRSSTLIEIKPEYIELSNQRMIQ